MISIRRCLSPLLLIAVVVSCAEPEPLATPTPAPLPTTTPTATATPIVYSTREVKTTATPTHEPLPTPTPRPTVRAIYASPADVAVNPAYLEAVGKTIYSIQEWYAGQLGGRTFEVDDSAPQHCALDNPATYYAREGGWDRTIDDLQNCAPVHYPSRFYVWVIYVDTPFDCEESELGAGWAGVAIMHGDDLRGLTSEDGHAYCEFWRPKSGYIGGAAHELGHAFGLEHPPGCDEGLDTCNRELLMSDGYAYDYPYTHLTESDIRTLQASPFLQHWLPDR